MRRELRFKTFEDALAELDRIEKGPGGTLGLWSQYQILNHCALAIDKSMDKFSNRAPWFIRQTLGRLAKRKILREGFMAPGQGDRKTNRVEGDAKAATAHLRESITKYRVYTGPLDDHPFCGHLTRDEWDKLHLYHMANHFGFIKIP